MTQHQRAHVDHTLILWAREYAGVDAATAAKKAGVRPEVLAAWEAGHAEPTIRQLRKLAVAYHVAFAMFYLPEPPQGFSPLRDYRLLPGVLSGTISSELNFAIRQARHRREIALDLHDELDEPPPEMSLRLGLADDPQEAGSRIRSLLDVTDDEQRNWRRTSIAYRAWRSHAEDAGFLQFQTGHVGVHEMRGFSIPEFPLPAVVVNRKDTSGARIFSLLHEIVHILLDDAGLCDIDREEALPPEKRRVEVFCNRVAGEALVPTSTLQEHPVVQGHRGDRWSDDDIDAIASRFAVSREVILRRLLIVGRTNTAFYHEKREEYRRAFDSRPRYRGEFHLAPHVNALSLTGIGYAQLALRAFGEGRITSSSLADCMGLRIRHLTKLHATVFSRLAP